MCDCDEMLVTKLTFKIYFICDEWPGRLMLISLPYIFEVYLEKDIYIDENNK